MFLLLLFLSYSERNRIENDFIVLFAPVHTCKTGLKNKREGQDMGKEASLLFMQLALQAVIAQLSIQFMIGLINTQEITAWWIIKLTFLLSSGHFLCEYIHFCYVQDLYTLLSRPQITFPVLARKQC